MQDPPRWSLAILSISCTEAVFNNVNNVNKHRGGTITRNELHSKSQQIGLTASHVVACPPLPSTSTLAQESSWRAHTTLTLLARCVVVEAQDSCGSSITWRTGAIWRPGVSLRPTV